MRDLFVEDIVHHLGGFELLLANTSRRVNDGYLVYISNSSDSDIFHSVILQDTLARFITITRFGVLTICEIEIYEGGNVLLFEIKYLDVKTNGYCFTTTIIYHQ